jgi:hypothetical protein
MGLESYHGNRPEGRGAHKTAKPITPTYASFLFLERGDMSSRGFALGFLELMIRIKIAISQKSNNTRIAILP